ncbi:NAD(P)H-quinone oxidoreductase [Boseongicola aestuarii]|uniref:Quinone oxidoreductase 1 n=1 Tax=Boseongicola aestuarii TaxID=1470561 RepID=A0A238IY74_9RHOB|nr:NAD(P)H-quinone oxidoreductase [Boseongicola aestuarii]SMX22991.1 Quinone oxidoreductase 1 [Boseongicola aestuarii]
MTNTMRAIEISTPGGPEVLTPCERPIPTPGVGEVLIRVAYAGVNGPDVHQRKGLYRAPADASDLPGLEASGHIAALGPGATGWREGDAVTALLSGGGYAEFATAPATHCLRIPTGLSLEQAAALPEAFFTVWSNVFMAGGLRAGQTVLVHGGTGGIGSTAIQLADRFGARVFATSGSNEKVALCEKLGAERGINYKTEDFVAVLRDAGRADLILDIVGGDYIQRNIKALKTEGRLQMIAFQSGTKAEIGFGEIMLRRLTLSGTTLRPQSVAAKAAIAEQLRAQVWPLLDAGRIAPVMDRAFPLEDAAAAHTALEADHIGKIVLTVCEAAA